MYSGAVLLSRSKYICELLSHTNMLEAKGISSPMVSNLKLSRFGIDTVSDGQFFRSIVGALQYATVTRPEIAYSVNKVCQFMSNPLDSHWRAVKRILRYLKDTINYGLLLQPATSSTKYSLEVFCDADWASDPDDCMSTSNLVSWSSKNQSLVAHSSTKAEYRSMAHATAEIIWIQSLLKELGIVSDTPTLYCDNLGVALSHNPVLHSRTKHMELDIHFVREKVVSKNLIVQHVPAFAQVADILTKPLSSTFFCNLRDKLKVYTLSPP
uniref:Copia protein n=1 Tax=Cajanus cajan TaxID=3821 RepID=A0A151R2K9_CAJCA|nr:Copia protein [Cajanus cajan]